MFDVVIVKLMYLITGEFLQCAHKNTKIMLINAISLPKN